MTFSRELLELLDKIIKVLPIFHHFFFTQELNNNVGSASKPKEDIRREKMSESVDVQNPTQINNHEVEEKPICWRRDFFLHVLCLACLV